MRRVLPSPAALFTGTLILAWFFQPGGGLPASALGALPPIDRIEVVARVSADHRRVSLLDLCNVSGMAQEWKDTLSKVDIGEAPAPGEENFIKPEQLKGFLDRFLVSQGMDPSAVQIELPEKITVKRESFQPPKQQIEDIYKEFILSKAPWSSQNLEIHSIYFTDPPQLPAGEMTYEVQAAPKERFVGNVAVAIQFYVDGVKDRTLRVTGKVDLHQDVVNTMRPLKRNEVITASDVELQKLNMAEAPDRFATDPDQVIGKRVLREMGMHQPIVLAELDSPLALKRGTSVRIVYEQPGISLTAKGQVQQDAVVGATVRVLNVSTNRSIICKVMDSETVQAMP
jgi:flagellar basal body P-ring formation protein FlgA